MKKRLLSFSIIACCAIVLISVPNLINAQNLIAANTAAFEVGSGSGPGVGGFSGAWARVMSTPAYGGVSGDVVNYLYRQTGGRTGFCLEALTPARLPGAPAVAPGDLYTMHNSPINMVNGHVYRLSFYYKNTSGHTFRAIVQGASGGATIASHTISTQAADWTHAEVEFTYATLTNPQVKFLFGFDEGTTNIDDVFLEDLTALPVTLTSFEAKKTLNSVILGWSTSSESNSQRFELLHSTNGADFRLIHSQLSNNLPSDYSFEHLNPFSGDNYYKLVQFDRNGTVADLGLKVVSYGLKSTGALVIYPNPTTQRASVLLDAPNSGKVLISMQGSDGRLISKQRLMVHKGIGRYVIPLDNIPPGAYLVNITGTDISQSSKLIVR